MQIDITNAIQACEWFSSSFLVISDNVFSPLLYYTYMGSAIPAILIALFVFISGKRSLEKFLLLSMVVSFTLWVFGAMVVWATEFPSYTMFFWTLLNTVEPFVYFFAFYFLYVHLFNKDLSILQKFLFSLPLLPTVVLAPTTFMLTGYILSDCDRNAAEGILAMYGYSIEILYVVAIIVTAIIALRSTTESTKRTQIFLISTGLSAFLLSFSLGNLLESFTDNWYIGQYGLLGAPLFTGVLAYLIVRYETFNIRLLGAQALVTTLLFLVFILLFLESTWYARVVVVVSLIFVSITGIYLVRSVKRDHLQNEQLQLLTENLQNTNHHLQEANAKIKIIDQRKDEFLSMASHQLRTPISTVKGYVSNILDGTYGPVDKHLLEPLGVIRDTSQTMNMYIEDYLNISRIEQNRMKYDFAEFDLHELVKEVAKDLKPTAEKRALELTVKAGRKLLVTADKEKIRQIISNITDNALKYTEKGSVALALKHDDQNAVITIQDTGIGISEAEMPLLFNKFSRSKDAHNVNLQGTGLGLYVAKQLAEGHHGTITVSSKGHGHGSTFTVSLPIEPPKCEK